MKRSLKRLLLSVAAPLVFTSVLAALLFLTAGRWDLPWFWVYVGMYGLGSFCAFLLFDPGLIKERLRPGRNARDAALATIGKVVSLAHCVIAALDVGRFHWSDDVPAVAQSVGFVLFVLAGAAAVWAMSVNPFFSPVVRIQEECGHRVITAGPYRLVRHPGYVAISVLMLASGVALGSWLSVLPMAVLVLLVFRRTALEDRFLHEHLDGYADYAARVRYRLIPLLW